jgi:glycosyltransferase involved in cell wall biosynthesis
VSERRQSGPGPSGLLEALEHTAEVDVVSLSSPLSASACRLLFRGTFAVLADSVHEPFGLVGLEAMAVRGLVCTGGTGEDYAEPGRNVLVLRDADARATACLLSHVRQWPDAISTLTDRAVQTARDYAWPRVIEGRLIATSEAAGAA